MICRLSVLILTLFNVVVRAQQLPPAFGKEFEEKTRDDNRIRKYISPQRIVWQSDYTSNFIVDANNLLKNGTGQAELPKRNLCVLKSTAKHKPGIILDFGMELHGGLQMITSMMNNQEPVRVRVRFGESVSEVMHDIDSVHSATNDHAMRDFVLTLPWLGTKEVGNSGFRFARIDLVDSDAELLLKEVSAIFIYRDISYKGSFKCDDERLNKIWLTGAYTVHLNMQEYLWDGIKRDRLVWVGDMYPEVMTIASVFGYNEVVPKSLDAAKDQTPLPGWMNTISAYSMWWVLIQREWFYYSGDKEYLQAQKKYLSDLLIFLMTKIDNEGKEQLDGMRFLDWPTSENKDAIHAGYQALLIMTLAAGSELLTILDDPITAEKCKEAERKMRKYIPPMGDTKQAAALFSLAGLVPPDKATQDVIAVGGAHNFSTFYGYFMLQAMAQGGWHGDALKIIKQYWGAMLDLGATTFWEDFNLQWMENASRIDEPVPAGKKDIHADYGDYCYKGLRHSLCHGWASGPTSWLTQHVLGVQVIEPGCKVLKIEPHLSELNWAQGTFPTPHGIVSIHHKKLANGKIETKVDAPKGIKIIK